MKDKTEKFRARIYGLQNEEVERLRQQTKSLIMTVSHEMRTPLLSMNLLMKQIIESLSSLHKMTDLQKTKKVKKMIYFSQAIEI